jgi:hypothetical protein
LQARKPNKAQSCGTEVTWIVPGRIIEMVQSLAAHLQDEEREEVQNFVMLKPAILLKIEMLFLPQVSDSINAFV